MAMFAEKMPELPRRTFGLRHPRETRDQFVRARVLHTEVQTILDEASRLPYPHEQVQRLQGIIPDWEDFISYFRKEEYPKISEWMFGLALPWVTAGERLVGKALSNLSLNSNHLNLAQQVDSLLFSYTEFRIRHNTYTWGVRDENTQVISEEVAAGIESLTPILTGSGEGGKLPDRLRLMTGILAGNGPKARYLRDVFYPRTIDARLIATLENLRQSLGNAVTPGINLIQEKQSTTPAPPEEMIKFASRRGEVVKSIQGGQSWVFKVKGHDQIYYAVTIFTRRNTGRLRELRRRNAEMVARAARNLPGDFKGAKIPIISEKGTDLNYGWDFTVAEWIEGRDLSEIIAQEGTYTEEKAIEVALEITRSTEWVYENYRLIHPDITPENVIFGSRKGQLETFLIDWSDSLIEGEKNHRLGKPAFAAPEQMANEGEINSQTMTWSLAVLLYFMLNGKGQAMTADGKPLYLSQNMEERFPNITGFSPEIQEIIEVATTTAKDRGRLTVTELVLKLESLQRTRSYNQVFQTP